MLRVDSLVEALVGIVAALLSVYLVPYIKSKTNAQQQEKLLHFLQIAVRAAEQIYDAPGQGEAKKTYVQSCLVKRGYKMENEIIEVMMEAAVHELQGMSDRAGSQAEAADSDSDQEKGQEGCK